MMGISWRLQASSEYSVRVVLAAWSAERIARGVLFSAASDNLSMRFGQAQHLDHTFASKHALASDPGAPARTWEQEGHAVV